MPPTSPKKRYPYFYERNKLKHVTGFLTTSELKQLKQMAKAADLSLTRYVTRLLQRHLKEKGGAGA